MENKKDFIYEYSDLNLFKNRVKVLTGLYADLILEYGHSHIERTSDLIKFEFEYELFEVPNKIKNIAVKGNQEFENFLTELLVNVIECRKNDPNEYDKLMQAASVDGVNDSVIEINENFYVVNKKILKKEIISKGLQKF